MASNCPSCGSLLTGHVCLSCGFVVEAEPASASEAAPPAGASPIAAEDAVWLGEPPPWEKRTELGFFGAFWQTWRDSVFRPVPFFRSLAARGPRGPALVYFLLVSATGLFFALYWRAFEAILGGGSESLIGAEQLGLQLDPGQQVTLLIAGTFVTFVFLIFLLVPVLYLSAAIAHVAFAAVGAGRQGFDGTFRAFCYSSGPAIFSLFPFFGQPVALVWGSVLLFIAMREVQRTTNTRATLGFILPLVAFFILFMLVILVLALILSTADVGSLI